MVGRPPKNKKYRSQRISEENVERVGKVGKMVPGDSFDDVLLKLLIEYKKQKEEIREKDKRIKELEDENKQLKLGEKDVPS